MLTITVEQNLLIWDMAKAWKEIQSKRSEKRAAELENSMDQAQEDRKQAELRDRARRPAKREVEYEAEPQEVGAVPAELDAEYASPLPPRRRRRTKAKAKKR